MTYAIANPKGQLIAGTESPTALEAWAKLHSRDWKSSLEWEELAAWAGFLEECGYSCREQEPAVSIEPVVGSAGLTAQGLTQHVMQALQEELKDRSCAVVICIGKLRLHCRVELASVYCDPWSIEASLGVVKVVQ